jgi:hypothetical protein
MYLFPVCLFLLSGMLWAQQFTCDDGQTDVMKYFVMAQSLRADH